MFISGKKIADKELKKLKNDFSIILKKQDINLAVFWIGNNPVIESFIKIKKKVANEIGINFLTFNYPKNITEEEIIKEIRKNNKKIDGLIIQLPLPDNLSKEKIFKEIDKRKDVDLLNPENIELFKKKITNLYPPVVWAVKKIIEENNFNLKDKNIVILGKGKLTGEPLSFWFDSIKINYKIITKKTNKKEKSKILKKADLIISGTGVSNLIKKEDISENAFLIDMGTSDEKGKIIGDIDKNCLEKTPFFSQTPGGVGPLTVIAIYKNLYNLIMEDKNK